VFKIRFFGAIFVQKYKLFLKSVLIKNRGSMNRGEERRGRAKGEERGEGYGPSTSLI